MDFNNLNVLSVFDGMSCGHLAFEKAGIKLNTYIASEVKPFAIKHTSEKYPDTIKAGDVTRLHYENGKLYKNCSRWCVIKDINVLSNEDKDRNKDLIKTEGTYTLIDIVNCVFDSDFDKNNIKLADYKSDGLLVEASELTKEELDEYKQNGFIDLPNQEIVKWEVKSENMIFDGEISMLIGGSPCQDFSAANAPNGRKYGLEGPKSRLFFDYLRLREEVNPTYFFLENVKMKKDSENLLNDYLGVEGFHMNSNLISIQDRARIYWTNIPNVDLNPTVSYSVDWKDYMIRTLTKYEYILYIKKFPYSYLGYPQGSIENTKGGFEFDANTKKEIAKYVTFDSNNNVIINLTNAEVEEIANIPSNAWARVELEEDNKQKYLKQNGSLKGYTPLTDREFVELLHEILEESIVKKSPSRDGMWYGKKIIDEDGNEKLFSSCKHIIDSHKISCLTRKQDRFPNSGLIDFGPYCRFVNKLEICKGQTVPYSFLSDLNYYEIQDVCGDGWTVDVIAHIFNYIKEKKGDTMEDNKIKKRGKHSDRPSYEEFCSVLKEKGSLEEVAKFYNKGYTTIILWRKKYKEEGYLDDSKNDNIKENILIENKEEDNILYPNIENVSENNKSTDKYIDLIKLLELSIENATNLLTIEEIEELKKSIDVLNYLIKVDMLNDESFNSTVGLKYPFLNRIILINENKNLFKTINLSNLEKNILLMNIFK